MKALIIEDEINAYEYLEGLMTNLISDIEIVDHIDSVEDSINFFHGDQQVDLVFMDIQLSDGLSFEIFKHAEVKAPIIFTTAYDEYAVRAFKLNSIDYLLKPISKDDLSHALQKFEETKGSNALREPEILRNILAGMNQRKRNRFLVKKGNHFEFISAQDIGFIHSEDSLTFLYTLEGRRHLYSKTIAHIEHELDTEKFFQINRKQVVNIDAVKKIHPFLNQRLKLDVLGNTGIEFIVSRNRSTDFKNWVDR